MLSIVNFGYLNRARRLGLVLVFAITVYGDVSSAVAQGRYATSDSHSGYVHWIELLDANNTKVDPNAEFPQPYSPERTCGRCHEFDTISHGWHFNATDPSAEAGRPGQPWIWSDPRSGTHLPLSYRGWAGTYDPDVLGLSRWEVAAKLGGFMPGGGVGSSQAETQNVARRSAVGTAIDNVARRSVVGTAIDNVARRSVVGTTNDNVARRSVVGTAIDNVARRSVVGTELNEAAGAEAAERDRSAITGATPIDCLLCHNNQGSGYSPFAWTEQIENQNFAYAPTVALGLAEVNGSMARLKKFDPAAADAASKLPKLTYNANRFRSDGKVFFDLVRKPQNNACNYCHTNVSSDSLTGSRWLHDEDVHVRAGMMCADCHRNSLDHHIVRGFEGERHVAGTLIASLSCQGCHLGSEAETTDPLAQAGRMGAPKPAHRGLPPLHFDKLSCTACHSGPQLEQQVPRQVNSIIHRLGEHVKRTGQELPAILGPVNLPRDYHQSDEPHSKYTPHRLFWPSFWGILSEGKVEPLNPEVAYELVRKPLKVRKDFTEEMREVSLTLSQRKELLGEDRARVKDEDRTAEEREKVQEAEKTAREAQIDERMQAALLAIEEQFPDKQAVYVTAGTGWVRDGDFKLEVLSGGELGPAAEPYAWPLAHNVRPARQALGAEGCTQCHSDEAKFFFAELKPVGLVPDQELLPVRVHKLQHADMELLKNWNQLFAGRSSFKIASLIALAATCLIALSILAWNIGSAIRRVRR